MLGHTQAIPMFELGSISSYTDKDDLGRTRDTREEEQGFREGDRGSSGIRSLSPYC